MCGKLSPLLSVCLLFVCLSFKIVVVEEEGVKETQNVVTSVSTKMTMCDLGQHYSC